GSLRACDTVVFALGYRDETDWVDIAGATTDSALMQCRGISPIPGLFYVGREWQSCRASALLCGVHRDARFIASLVERHLRQSPRRSFGRAQIPAFRR